MLLTAQIIVTGSTPSIRTIPANKKNTRPVNLVKRLYDFSLVKSISIFICFVIFLDYIKRNNVVMFKVNVGTYVNQSQGLNYL